MRVFGLSLILLVLVILSVRWFNPDTPAPSAFMVSRNPVTDYYLRQVSIATLGVDGRPERLLQAAEIRHFANDLGTQLHQPILTLYPTSGPPWRMVADSGWLDETGDTLSLSDRVQLSRAASTMTAPMQLQTEALQMQLPHRYLETSRPVQISSGWQQLQAIGMRAWLQAPVKIEFLREVEGIYVPKNH